MQTANSRLSTMDVELAKPALTKLHYESHSTSSYEDGFFSSEGIYMDYLCQLTVDALKPAAGRLLLDVGGGTGNFTRRLVAKQPGYEAVVIDPFLENSDTTQTSRVKFVKAPAESFAKPENVWWRKGYHQVLIKEAIHHVESKDRIATYHGIRKDLEESGDGKTADYPRVLIITRPQQVDYPMWDAAREVWASNQPSVDQLVSELEETGFKNVSSTMEIYPCAMPFERWAKMVKTRCWSTFSHFSDAELEKACEEMYEEEQDRMDKHGIVRFEDRLVFITAYL